MCVPSRAGLFTGRCQTRFGVESNVDGPLPATERTIGDRMRQAGYATALVGKWHLATSRTISKKAKSIPRDQIIWDDNTTIDDPNLPGQRRFDEYFCGAMVNFVASFDLAGRSLQKPTLVNDRRDTLLFLVSDNGAPLEKNMWDGSLNDPLLGAKGMLTDAGIRVPFLAGWPGTIEGGRQFPDAVSTLDILPTALAAMATERWKLLFVAPDQRRLYDLTAPDGERRDVAADHPAVVGGLFADLTRWCGEQSPAGLPTSPDKEDAALFGNAK